MLERQMSPDYHPEHGENFLSRAFASLDQRFHNHNVQPEKPQPQQDTRTASGKPTLKEFQNLVKNFEHTKTAEREEEHHKIDEQHKHQVGELINHHVNDANWEAMLHTAREVAEQGGKESMLIRFPCDLCSDSGREINVGEPTWPETLRGEAAEIYLRWEQDLKPQGFRLSARTLEYPGGFPGDIGLFLVWGH
jgi:hypothetical protein